MKDTTLYGPQHDIGTVIDHADCRVIVEFRCRCATFGDSPFLTTDHRLTFEPHEIRPLP